ncbi:MAG: cytochrome c peroxidase [Bacteroidota bacterium]
MFDNKHSYKNYYKSKRQVIALPFMFILFIAILVAGCKKDRLDNMGIDLTDIPYDPVEYQIVKPFDTYPNIPIPPDNPITLDGFELGRHLFYDPILSADSSMSCNSCHQQEANFTDAGKAVSKGIAGIEGHRSSMSLLNAGLFTNKLFWDGRVDILEEQALLPVEDPIELNNTWEEVIKRLQRHPEYPAMFRKAFGISNSSLITKELAAKAIAQFERALIPSGDAKYDRFKRGEIFFSDEEQFGFELFFDGNLGVKDAECGHCHNAPLFTTNEYFNNGLDSFPTLNDYIDKGRGGVTEKYIDMGTFRAPSLRNIMVTAPFMHDGRFATIEEVMEHYNSGGFSADNSSPLMRDINLNQEEIEAVIAFLHTLTDSTFLNDPRFSNPFE